MSFVQQKEHDQFKILLEDRNLSLTKFLSVSRFGSILRLCTYVFDHRSIKQIDLFREIPTPHHTYLVGDVS